MTSPKILNLPLQGSCFCGAIGYTLTSKPLLSAYCHCTNCQRLSGCPFVHTVHFPATHFSWNPRDSPATSLSTSSVVADQVRQFSLLDSYAIANRPHKTRFRCKTCGACVASHNTAKNTISIWGAHLKRDGEGKIEMWELVKPSAHIFYGTRMLDIKDDLGKWKGYEGKSDRIE
ncbi:Mss4-like protein [Irpex lacteus]|nr:Mss4-like protein [Irpex lacteus]